MGNRPMACLALLLFVLVDFICAQGSSPYGTFNAPYYQQNVAGTTYAYINFRYEGCYAHTSDPTNPVNSPGYVLRERELIVNGTGTAAITSYENCALACWGGADYRDGEATPRRYSNFQYMAVVGGNQCLCGNSTRTSIVSNATARCWNTAVANGASHRLCRGNSSEYCGGDTGALVFLRTDIGGTCATNSSGSLDYPCFETSFTNRSISTYNNEKGAFNYSAVMLSGDRNYSPYPFTTTNVYSPNIAYNNGFINSPFRNLQATTSSGYANETYEINDYRYVGCYQTGANYSTNSALPGGSGNVLQFNDAPASIQDQNSCVQYCWSSINSTNKYPNFAYAALSGSGNGSSQPIRCYCGQNVRTPVADPSLCFGPNATVCTGNANQLCGGPTAAIVFGRADFGGTCDAPNTGNYVNNATTNDHDWYDRTMRSLVVS